MNTARNDLPTSSGRRALDWLLLTFLVVGVLLTLWLPDRVEAKGFLVLVLLIQCVDAWRSRDANRRLFESLVGNASNRNEYVRLGIITLIAGVLLFLVCFATGAFRGGFFAAMFDKSATEWVTVKVPTIIAQQAILQLLLAPILLRLFGKVAVAVLVGAIIFALFHLPNLVLFVLTLTAGAVWLSSFYRARKLTPIVLSHALLAVLTAGFCGEYVLNMRVGASCVELLPRQVEAESGFRYEFPRCVVGCSERLSQSGGHLIVEGWVYDSVHHRCPSSLLAKVSGRLVELTDVKFERASSERWANSRNGGFVSDYCYSFVAKVPISNTQVPYFKSVDMGADWFTLAEFELYAANINGCVAQLGRMGELKAIDTMATDQTIVLFPVEVDGRVDWVDWEGPQIRLKGWAADVKASRLAEKICIESDGMLSFVDLAEFRLHRPSTADALNQPNLVECGFEIPAENLSIYQLDSIQCYAVDQQQQLHPISLTDRAEQRVANRLQRKTIIR